MTRVLICSTVLAVLACGGVLASENAGEAGPPGSVRPTDFDATLTSLYSRDTDARLRAVQELSGWALVGSRREEALAFLRLARHDSEVRVVLQAEVAIASLTGGSRQDVRAAYGIFPPDPRELAGEALQGKTPDERRSALVALGRWHGEAEIDTLLAVTLDPAPEVRLQAVEFLYEIAAEGSNDARIKIALESSAKDPDPAVRKLAESFTRSLR